jgi:hypothetical protein
MAFELAECGCGVSLIDDQEPVEEFAADRCDEALGDRVRLWRRAGVLTIRMSLVVKRPCRIRR